MTLVCTLHTHMTCWELIKRGTIPIPRCEPLSSNCGTVCSGLAHGLHAEEAVRPAGGSDQSSCSCSRMGLVAEDGFRRG